MARPYATVAQVLNQALTSLATQAKWNLTDPGTVAVQDITYTAKGFGLGVTLGYVAGATAGAESVAVSGSTVTVTIASGTSTATQVLAALAGSAAALALVSASITGTAGTAQVATTAPVPIEGDVSRRIAEADSEIDTRLAGLEVALPLASNPPLLNVLSVLYARYACFRDLYAAGQPSKVNPNAVQYREEFEAKWDRLAKGWAKLVDSTGAVVASTKFATVTIEYEDPATAAVDQYPNYPSGPYPDPPSIGA